MSEDNPETKTQLRKKHLEILKYLLKNKDRKTCDLIEAMGGREAHTYTRHALADMKKAGQVIESNGIINLVYEGDFAIFKQPEVGFILLNYNLLDKIFTDYAKPKLMPFVEAWEIIRTLQNSMPKHLAQKLLKENRALSKKYLSN